jgi:hypothetical protein
MVSSEWQFFPFTIHHSRIFMKYDEIIRSGPAGVYAAPRLAGPLRAAAKRAGVSWHDLDLDAVSDRAAFLRRCAEVLPLPVHFGRNWDALHESVIDFAGATPGAIVHWRRGAALARRSPESVTTALEIFQEAAMYAAGRVFLVVVDRDSARGVDLPTLR